MRKISLIAFRADARRIGLAWLSVSMLSACSAIETNAPAQQNLPVSEPVASVQSKLPAVKLTADQVYRVLAAESLYLRGETASAAQVYIDLAQRYSDAGLAQRAYDLSASSGNAQLLGQASQLNTELNPNRIESWQVQVVLALRANNVEKAWQAWRSFYEQGLAKGNSEKSLYMATATLVQDDLSIDTLIAFSARIAQEQPSPYAEFVQVMFLASANRLSDAYNRLTKALERYVDQPELAQMLASLSMRLADGRGVDWLVGYVQRHPEDLVVGEQLGRLYVTLQQLPLAKAQFARLLEQNPRLNSVSMSLALIELELGNAAVAEKLLLPLVDDRRLSDMARYYLGQAYYFQQQNDAAVAQWKQVVQGNYRLDALVWRVQLLSKQKRFAEAQALISAFESANDEEYVRWVQAHVKLLVMQKKAKLALPLLDKAIFSYPQVVELWQERANIKYELSDGAGFEQDMREALSLAPENADVLNALGFYLADQGRSLPEARQLLEKADRLSPNKHYILDSLGWLAYQEGQYDQALALLDKAYAIKADAEILRHRLAVLLAMKQTDKAKSLAKQEAKQFSDDVALTKFLNQMSLMP
ncbi:MAG: tetratricopeptide repeat protein [Gammaproteobacteria bacterium]|nr:tetratricopeptide repeat protein [Gammaproteobacteria bacterium]